VVGLIAGWLAGQIVRGTGFGLLADIAIGIVGALIGAWLLPQLGIHLGSGMVAAIISATIGALLLLLILRVAYRGGRWWLGHSRWCRDHDLQAGCPGGGWRHSSGSCSGVRVRDANGTASSRLILDCRTGDALRRRSSFLLLCVAGRWDPNLLKGDTIEPASFGNLQTWKLSPVPSGAPCLCWQVLALPLWFFRHQSGVECALTFFRDVPWASLSVALMSASTK